VEYRPFGRTGLEVSAIGFGCWEVGGGYGDIEVDDFDRAIARALDLGINCFDTAEGYGMGASEVALGKALGSGVPIGAALVGQEVADTVSYGDHGTTYGGNLLACRAALTVLGEIFDRGIAENVKRVAPAFEQRLRAIAAKHPIVKEVRGAGLMWGLELGRDAAPIVPAGLERGVIVNRTAETVVRLLPPYIITEAEALEALGRLDATLGAVGASS